MPGVWEVFYALVFVAWKFRWEGTSGVWFRIRPATQGKEYDCQTYKRVVSYAVMIIIITEKLCIGI